MGSTADDTAADRRQSPIEMPDLDMQSFLGPQRATVLAIGVQKQHQAIGPDAVTAGAMHLVDYCLLHAR